MKSITVHHYDAFSTKEGKGNPAGVVLNSAHLTEEEMQEIALKVGFNETSFPVYSNVADLRIRFFTPGHEMNLCGHATIATLYALKTRGLLEDKTEFTIETKVGVLPVSISSSGDTLYIKMKQASPQFHEWKGSRKKLAASIGLNEEDLEDRFPILYGSTGTWTLLIPIKRLEAFERMQPDNPSFPALLNEIPKASLHPFCLETYDQDADMHARHFSSPFSGTIEDAVTGTASGVMGAYYARYIEKDKQDFWNFVVEQGHETGKDGRVWVDVSYKSGCWDIEITGTAVYVKDLHFDIGS